MDRERLLELAGITKPELSKVTKEFLDSHNGNVKKALKSALNMANLGRDTGWLPVIRELTATTKQNKVTEAEGESKMSSGMTGQEFDIDLETPDQVTILKHNKDTGVTIPINNWDKIIGAYNRIKNKKHNY